MTAIVALLWLAFAGVARAAPAEQASRRIAVIGPPDAPVTRQLDAELALFGFDVVHAPQPDAIAPEALRALAADLDVAAAILVDSHDDRLDLWVVDRVTGKTTIRVIAVEDAASPDAARIGAVRAIDLLRASFRELEHEPDPPSAEVAPSRPVRIAARPPAPRFGISFGPAIAGSPGGIGPTAHVALGFQFMPHRIFGLTVGGLAPIVGARVSAPEGTARIHIGWLTAGPSFALAPPTSIVHAHFAPCVGPVFVGMRGEASPPYAAGRDLVVSALLELQLQLAVDVHARLRIRLDGSLGVAVPRVGVRFGGRRVATWGLPVGVGVLALQVVL